MFLSAEICRASNFVATDVGITPQIAEIIQHMMEAEDAKPGFLDEL
jgi:hypothetical protein